MKFKKALFSLTTLLAGSTGLATAAMALSCGDMSGGVVLVFDNPTSVVEDKGFHQSIFDGIKAYTNSEPNIFRPSSPETSAILTTYSMVPNGSLIVAAGSEHGNAVAHANKGELTGKNLILFDAPLPDATPEAVKALVVAMDFKLQTLTFVAGYSLAKYVNEHYDDIFKNSLTTTDDDVVKISTFGGMEVLPVTSAMTGFRSGVKAYVAGQTGVHVKWVDLARSEQHFSGSFAPGSGITVAKSLITTAGVDILFPVAGPQITDAISVFKETNNPGKVVGFDTAQEDIYNILPSEGDHRVLFSMVRNLSQAIKDMLTQILTDHDTTMFGTTKRVDVYSQQDGVWVPAANALLDISDDEHSLIHLRDVFNTIRANGAIATQAEAISSNFDVNV